MNETVVERLRSFYTGHRQQLYTYAVAITRQREAAEDAIHQAFQQLLRRSSLPEDFRPYIFRCVRNAAVDSLRRTRVRSAQSGDGILEPASVPAELPEPWLAAELEQALAQLTPNEREAIVLKIYDDLTFQEIAAVLQAPLPTAASWYRRGLEKLKANLSTRKT